MCIRVWVSTPGGPPVKPLNSGPAASNSAPEVPDSERNPLSSTWAAPDFHLESWDSIREKAIRNGMGRCRFRPRRILRWTPWVRLRNRGICERIW